MATSLQQYTGNLLTVSALASLRVINVDIDVDMCRLWYILSSLDLQLPLFLPQVKKGFDWLRYSKYRPQ